MVDSFAVAFVGPVIVFLVVVAPIWLFLHYRSKARVDGQLSETEREELEILMSRTERMAERIETLEAILDSEAPGWRRRPGDVVDDVQEVPDERRAQSV